MPNKQIYSEQEQAVIRRIAGMMIGPSEEFGLPGADDEVIATRIVQRAIRVEGVLKGAIQSILKPGEEVTAISDEEFAGHIERLSDSNAEFIQTLVMLTAQSYYEDARVLISLNKEARPPFPLGHSLEQGDWSLLDPVKKKGCMYRRVEQG